MNTSVRESGAGFGMIPESGLFAGICALLTVFFVGFFTAGLFLGHHEFDGPVGASATQLESIAANPAMAVSDAGLHAKAQPVKAIGILAASATALAAGNDNEASSPRPILNPSESPAIPSGAIVVQVAALLSQAAAADLAKTLRQRHFSAFVLTSETDNFYRVQIGPFVDAVSAKIARQQLEGQGYNPILKRR